MPIRVYYEVLNQKGTPALYSDNYANRPAAGYVGRIFYSPDTAQIFYDTGSTWTLLADAGVGSGSLASVCANGNTTATGISITAGGLSTNSLTSTNLTAGSIPFIGTGGLFSQDNTNLFWDNTNKYFGINTNTPSTNLDIHGTNNVLVQVNNTTTADSKIAFLQAGAGKWRIGNLYSGGTNLFHIYNNAAISLAMQIDSSNAALFYGSLSSNSFISAASGITLTNGGTTTTAGATNIGGLTAGLNIALASGFNQTLTFPTGVAYTYTFPSATGTLALTSNLSSYLPLTGGTLSGALTINSTLYINPTNTALTGLDVASNTINFRSDNLEGSKRLLQVTMASGTLISLTGQGYGAARVTDIAFYTSSSGGVNATPAIYLTGGNNVGIGTGSASYKLDVNGTGRFTSGLYANSLLYLSNGAGSAGGIQQAYNAGSVDSRTYWISNDVNSYGDFVIQQSTTQTGSTFATIFSINKSGSVMINETSSTAKFTITAGSTTESTAHMLLGGSGYSGFHWLNGTAYYIGQNSQGRDLRVYSGNNTAVGVVLNPNATAWTSYSDERLKTNIEEFEPVLDKINTLKAIKYNLINVESESKRYGLIAQDLLGKFDEVISYNKYSDDDDTKYLGVRYTELIPVLVKAVQELNQKIDNLN